MPNVLMMVFIGFDVLFAACGGLLMGFSLVSEQTMRATPTLDNVARNLLLDQCPLTGTVMPYLERGSAAAVQWHYRGGSCLTPQ
jgi:hypothetical protein